MSNDASRSTSSVSSWVPRHRDQQWRTLRAHGAARDFHRTLEGYEPTRIVDLPSLAKELGVGRVIAKDESSRLGLPSFKALGASWAVHRVVEGSDETLSLVTATDGNHGRAVAHFARMFGHRAEIYVPAGVREWAMVAIEDEGAQLIQLDKTYEVAVQRAAVAAAEQGRVLVQDAGWPGYTKIPQDIIDGYDTLFTEIDEQVADADLVIVPTGVGSLLHAALTHYRGAGTDTRVIAVQPEVAANLAPSFAADRPVIVQTGETLMAGLNTHTPSWLSWPIIRATLDGVAHVGDDAAVQAARDLAELGVDAGPCGAASLAGLRAAAASPGALEHLGLDETSTVVLLITEGTETNPLP
ncbi:pyridoxal-phosphate dependent enzyme [Agrococcus casei]